MESRQDDHDIKKHVFELSLVTFNFGLLSAIAFSKLKFWNFGWPRPFNRGKDNKKKPTSGRPEGDRGRLI